MSCEAQRGPYHQAVVDGPSPSLIFKVVGAAARWLSDPEGAALNRCLVAAATDATNELGADLPQAQRAWVVAAICELPNSPTVEIRPGSGHPATALGFAVREALGPDFTLGDHEIDLDGLFGAIGRHFWRALRAEAARPTSPVVRLVDRLEQDEVLDEARGSSARDPDGALRLELKKSWARNVVRLTSLGMDSERAEELARDREIGRPPEQLELEPGTVVFLVGDLGAGKSTIAEGIYQNAIWALLKNESDRAPAFLEGSRAPRSAIADLLESSPDEPTLVVVDALDEAAADIAGELLVDAQRLVTTNPRATVLITSRPIPLVETRQNRVHVPPLDRGQIVRLVSRVSGLRDEDIDRRLDGQHLTEALELPLFALLYGIRLGDWSPESAPSRAELLAAMVGRAIGNRGATVSEALGKLGAKAVDRAYRPVALADVTTQAPEQDALGRTGLLRFEDGGVTFPIALLAQWFAAQHLLASPALTHDIAQDALRSDRWRDALSIAVATGGSDEIDVILGALAERRVAYVPWVLHEARRVWPAAVNATLSRDEAARHVRHAMDALLVGIGPLAKLVGPQHQGQQLAIGIEGSGTQFWLGWFYGDTNEPLIRNLPSTPQGRWAPPGVGAFGSVDVDGPTWAWGHACGVLVRRLSDLLQTRRFAPSQLKEEEAWLQALKVGGRSENGLQPSLRLEDLEAKVHEAELDGADISGNGRNEFVVVSARRFVDRLRSEGVETIDPPWPGPDQEATDGWGWSFWSPNQMWCRLNAATAAAVEGYGEVVDVALPAFRDELSVARARPLRLVGDYNPGTPGTGLEGAPTFAWRFEPASDGEPAASWTIAPERVSWFTWEEWEELHATWERARPDLSEIGAPLNWHGGFDKITDAAPATELMHEMLWDDLATWKWVDGTFKRSR